MEESLEEEASSSRGSYSSDRKNDNKLMRQALNYQFMMKGRSKTKNEMGEEMFLDSTVPETGQDPFSTSTDYKGCGLGVYANPYLEIFNVATATAGIYPFETNTTEERKRIQGIPEPIFFMESYVDDIDNEDTSDLECEQTSELTEMSLDIVKQIPVTRHLKPTVVTTTTVCDNSKDNNGGLSSKMQSYIRQTVDSRIEKWHNEGKLQNVSQERIDGLKEQLYDRGCVMVSSKIKSFITGETKVDQPLPVIEESTVRK